MLEFNSS